MKRLLVVCLVALVGVCTAAGAVSASAPHAKLRGFVCKRALLPMNRAVSVTAKMRPLGGTRQMALKFELVGRNKRTGKLIHVKAGDLGSWIRPGDRTLGSQPGDVWIFRHPVKDLVAPVTYRFRVRFRWIGKSGHTIAEALKVSRPCYEPERRPDLLVSSIQVKPVSGQPNTDRYVVVIRNAGPTAAGSFQVALSDGTQSEKVTVPRLARRSSVKESFVGPACSSVKPPVVTVDPSHRVPDSNLSNNSATASCP